MSFAKNFPPMIPIVVPTFNSMDDVNRWAQELSDRLQFMQQEMSEAFTNIAIAGALADRPDPNNTGRFFFDTATKSLQYDDGVWNAI